MRLGTSNGILGHLNFAVYTVYDIVEAQPIQIKFTGYSSIGHMGALDVTIAENVTQQPIIASYWDSLKFRFITRTGINLISEFVNVQNIFM